MPESANGFDTAVAELARKKNGDAVTNELFWEIVIALDQDSARRHRETMQLLNQHVADEKFRRTMFAIVAAIVAVLLIFAGLEFWDQEKFAGTTTLALTVVIALGGWFLANRKK